MNAYEFLDRNPWLSIGLALIVAIAVEQAIGGWCRIIRQWVRYRTIEARGWPPSHLDADGDWKPAPEPEIDEGED